MIEKRVREYIEKHRMIASGDRALIGLSGGADSAALFHILRKLQKSLDFRLLAVHVNHGLRGAEAARDQEFVENLCKLADAGDLPAGNGGPAQNRSGGGRAGGAPGGFSRMGEEMALQ